MAGATWICSDELLGGLPYISSEDQTDGTGRIVCRPAGELLETYSDLTDVYKAWKVLERITIPR